MGYKTRPKWCEHWAGTAAASENCISLAPDIANGK